MNSNVMKLFFSCCGLLIASEILFKITSIVFRNVKFKKKESDEEFNPFAPSTDYVNKAQEITCSDSVSGSNENSLVVVKFILYSVYLSAFALSLFLSVKFCERIRWEGAINTSRYAKNIDFDSNYLLDSCNVKKSDLGLYDIVTVSDSKSISSVSDLYDYVFNYSSYYTCNVEENTRNIYIDFNDVSILSQNQKYTLIEYNDERYSISTSEYRGANRGSVYILSYALNSYSDKYFSEGCYGGCSLTEV